MERALRQINLGRMVDADLAQMLHQARVFGLHVARLDIRQYSDFNTAVLDELLNRLGLHDNFAELEPADRATLLAHLLQEPIPDLDSLTDLSAETQETLALFQILERAVNFYGAELIGPYIVSMTHGPEDILAPLLLAYWHGLCLRPGTETEGLTFAPLLETREDLQHGPAIMTALFTDPAYAPPPGAGGPAANDHDRLFGQQQGCGLPGSQLGTVPGAGGAGGDVPRPRRDDDAVSTGVAARLPAAAAQPTGRFWRNHRGR